jgi:hypothetical protein
MWTSQVTRLLTEAGFRDVRRKRFVYKLNSLYIAMK